MNAKEFLKQYLNLEKRIEFLEREIEHYEDMATNITASTDGMPRSGAISDKVGELAAKIVDETMVVISKRRELIDKRREILEVIYKVEDRLYFEILYHRYIQGESWEEIAVEMHYTYRWITSLHGNALKEIDKILNSSY